VGPDVLEQGRDAEQRAVRLPGSQLPELLVDILHSPHDASEERIKLVHSLEGCLCQFTRRSVAGTN
jgi:hypothetical protein